MRLRFIIKKYCLRNLSSIAEFAVVLFNFKFLVAKFVIVLFRGTKFALRLVNCFLSAQLCESGPGLDNERP